MSGRGRCSYSAGTQAASSLFRLSGGEVLRSVQTLIFCSLMENSTACFATSSSRVYLTVLLNALLLPRHSYFLRPRFLMLILHLGCIHHLFLNICPSGVPSIRLSMVHLFSGFRDNIAGRWSSHAPIVSTAAFFFFWIHLQIHVLHS
jgi:hypothetical protein